MTIFTPKLILILASVVVVFILLALVQEMNRRWQVQREVASLEQEIRAMENKVVELEQINQYFRTPDYLERVAREKLNYHAPGEQVVLIPDEVAESAVLNSEESSQRPVAVWRRWWDIFFVEETPLQEILTSSL
jgi:cell division protein FtsB